MFAEFVRRLLMLFRRRQFDAGLDEEMRLHRELREQDLIEAGVALGEARYAARRRFGNDLVLREESRDMWGWNWLENLYAGHPFRTADVGPESGFHRRGGDHPGARHWGEHGHLQCGECRPAETTALCRP